jgi:hypothetical protein
MHTFTKMMLSSSFAGVLVAFSVVSSGLAFKPSYIQPRFFTSTASSQLHATWSDSRAVKEYQEFLSSGRQEIEKLSDRQSVIVKPAYGDDALANALLQMGMGDDVVSTVSGTLISFHGRFWFTMISLVVLTYDFVNV